MLDLGNEGNWEILAYDRVSEEAKEKTVIAARGMDVQ